MAPGEIIHHVSLRQLQLPLGRMNNPNIECFEITTWNEFRDMFTWGIDS